MEKKDCKTTYQYKCKEYRKQVTDQITEAFSLRGEIFPPSGTKEIYHF